MNAYQLFNPVEPKAQVPTLVNTSYETAHPLEPVVYIQLQAEALYGVRLGCVRLSSLLVQFYGYNVARVVRDNVDEIEKLDVRMARDDADTHDVFHNEAYARPGLVAAIRQSIPGDVVTLSERLAEVS
ncbi:hypothetical protein [Vibrio parahaemolyticus]|uniref:hypothetical protein n=1 Tax=Vibrio parahaemolyticus TaxID=670 RepID=UPI00215C1D2B|nr:hypothetical protein [Vibrio parahaemolyticus]EGQ8535741.1 hypothetical protein [Vibrio parahaemolyticus]EJB8505207.1 hypothetical protein [Vibrio parahaemolyticus]EJL3960103.1 hypothetical protein [Vibrio parahaemolyticus]MCR9868072.1 hypothetical protein [Vibrio parahaemolyticus]